MLPVAVVASPFFLVPTALIGGAGFGSWAGALGNAIAGGCTGDVARLLGEGLGGGLVGGGLGRLPQGAFDYSIRRVLMFTLRNLQKGFTKHGTDFGMTGNWNPARAAEFAGAVNQHINAPGTQVIIGTYRGDPVIHYYNPSTGANVISDPNGNYISGWILGGLQRRYLVQIGALQ